MGPKVRNGTTGMGHWHGVGSWQRTVIAQAQRLHGGASATGTATLTLQLTGRRPGRWQVLKCY